MTDGGYMVREYLHRANLWAGKGPVLARLDMELTERCNNDCIHCYINQPAEDPDVRSSEMSAGAAKAVLDEAASLGCLEVRFTGGEPLLREDFPEIYLHARRLGVKVVLCTNATLATPEIARLLKRYPPGATAEISVYGADRKEYEAVSRRNGSFDAAMAGISRLEEAGVRFRVKGIGPGERLSAMDGFAGAHGKTAEGASFSVYFMLRARRDSRAKNRRIQQLRLPPEKALAVLTRDADRYVKEKKAFAKRFMRPAGTKLFSCGCGIGGSVDARGDFQPCLLMRHPDTVYPLENGSMQDALERFFPGLREKPAKNPAYLEKCARCFLHGLCEQCPAWSWMEHGTLDTPVDYLCAAAHVQARFLGLVEEGEKAWEVKSWRERINRFAGD